MKITSALFEAFLKCATKCHLRSLGETGSGNEYAEWVRVRDESYPREAARRLQEAVPETDRVVAPPATENLKTAKWRLAVDLVAQASALPLPRRGGEGRGEGQELESAAKLAEPPSAATERASSLSPREERAGREPERGALQKTQGLLSPTLSSLLRREEREQAIPVHGKRQESESAAAPAEPPPSSSGRDVHRSADALIREAQPGEGTRGLSGPRSEAMLESHLHAVERVPSAGRGKPAQFVPIRFIFRNKLTPDDRLLLAFDALVLFQGLGRDVSLGKIIHGDDHATLNVKLGARTAESARSSAKPSGLLGEVSNRLEKIAALLSSPANPRSEESLVRASQATEETRGLGGSRSGPAPPDLVLNRHCAECEFQARCRKLAVETDDRSLLAPWSRCFTEPGTWAGYSTGLAGMSAKERQQLRSKGIFTVTQLSYTFRPRRRPKRQRDKREKYHHSLKALAIREKKIHIVGSPELKIEGTPVYLDVEGLPDRDFYYLIGLRIGSGVNDAPCRRFVYSSCDFVRT